MNGSSGLRDVADLDAAIASQGHGFVIVNVALDDSSLVVANLVERRVEVALVPDSEDAVRGGSGDKLLIDVDLSDGGEAGSEGGHLGLGAHVVEGSNIIPGSTKELNER